MHDAKEMPLTNLLPKSDIGIQLAGQPDFVVKIEIHHGLQSVLAAADPFHYPAKKDHSESIPVKSP